MEEKKQEWQLKPQEQEPQQSESKVDKVALADYILSRLPQELKDQLEAGRDISSLVTEWENKMLKKENEALKSRLEKQSAKPLTLAGEGGEGEKDPFVAGFMQALTNY